jgi:hypothetical protein
MRARHGRERIAFDTREARRRPRSSTGEHRSPRGRGARTRANGAREARGQVETLEDQGRERMIVEVDAGGARQLDTDYIEKHLQYAYALTDHGLQGGTVEWVGVIGPAECFSRNWSSTAVTRAREPSEIFLIDAPMGRNGGHPWGVSMAAYGEVSWPPSLPRQIERWVPSARLPRARGQSHRVAGGDQYHIPGLAVAHRAACPPVVISVLRTVTSAERSFPYRWVRTRHPRLAPRADGCGSGRGVGPVYRHRFGLRPESHDLQARLARRPEGSACLAGELQGSARGAGTANRSVIAAVFVVTNKRLRRGGRRHVSDVGV